MQGISPLAAGGGKTGGRRGPLDAVFFDMDGTIVDSEPFTDTVVLHLIRERGLRPPPFPLSQFHGVTWESIAATLAMHYPEFVGVPLVRRMQDGFHALFESEPPPLIAGLQQAFLNASRVARTGIVSSSPRATIGSVVARAGLQDACSVIVGAENVQRSKPDPECYLVAATQAGAAPERCLVFEDSAAGLQAAHAAGMYAIGVLGNREPGSAMHLETTADCVIANYEELPAGFFQDFGTAP